MLSLLNSKIGNAFAKLINPTINTPTGDIQKIPVLFNKKIDKTIVNTSSKNVAMSKTDWDSFETSWDFTRHPILSKIDEHNRNWNLKEAFEVWKSEAQDRFDQLKDNEEELNRIFTVSYTHLTLPTILLV